MLKYEQPVAEELKEDDELEEDEVIVKQPPKVENCLHFHPLFRNKWVHFKFILGH